MLSGGHAVTYRWVCSYSKRHSVVLRFVYIFRMGNIQANFSIIDGGEIVD